MEIICNPDEKSTHHLHLKGTNSDGKTSELGLILCDEKGTEDPKQIKRRPYPRSAIKTYTGQQKYSDLEPPFEIIAIDDLSDGRGKAKYDDDQGKYYDGWRVDTRKSGRIIMGPQETYCTGDYRDVEQSMPGSVKWEKLNADNPNKVVSFVAGASFTSFEVMVWLRKFGDPGSTVEVALLASDDSVLANEAIVIDTACPDKMSALVAFDVSGQSITATNTFKIKIINNQNDADDDNCFAVATDGTDLYYRLVDSFGGDSYFRFFPYDHQVYAVSMPYDGSNSKLYMCGYRGMCDANAGDLDKLIDASRSGSGWNDSPFADDAIGGIVVIYEGPGSGELQNFRTVTAKDSGTQLSISPNWNKAHTTASQYVLIMTDHWYEIDSDLGDLVTDIAVADRFVYFAFGEDTAILRYEEYNNAGTWAVQQATEDYYAKYILAIRDPTAGTMIFGTRDDHDTHGTHVWRARVPLQWGNLYSLIGTVMSTDSPWDARTTGNITNTVTGGISKIAVATDFNTGDASVMDCDSVDITQADKFGFLVRSSVSQDAGDLQIGWSDAANFGGTETYEDFPALVENKWTWVTIDVTPDASDETDDGAVLSFGIKVITDRGAFDLEFMGGILTLRENPWYTQLPGDALITGIRAYAGGQSGTHISPWVFTENKVYEIQPDNSYAAVPLPIDEMESLRGVNTGRASTVNDVYLWFSLGVEKTERYYNFSLDDAGVDADEGLPEDRRGIVRALASYPGGVLEVVDAGASGYSSVLYKTGGWHELYRATVLGTRIEDIFIQSIPGDTMQRLWISQHGDIVWIPLALSPESSSNYPFAHDCMLQVGKAFSNLQDVEKFFSSVKLITENLNGTSQFIEVDYKTDSDSDWVTLDDTFDTSASQSQLLSSNNDVSGVWIEVRVRMYSEDNSISPAILGVLVESMIRVPVKFAYDITFRLKNEDILLTEGKGWDDQTARAKLDILDDWVSVTTPIKMYSHSEFEDDRWVFPEPSPVTFIDRFVEEGVELRVASLTLVEI